LFVWKNEREFSAAARFALKLDSRTVVLRAVLDDRQTQAGPADPAARMAYAVKTLENATLLRIRDPYAGVGDRQPDLAFTVFDTDRYLAPSLLYFIALSQRL
jgi:hypothetical protein